MQIITLRSLQTNTIFPVTPCPESSCTARTFREKRLKASFLQLFPAIFRRRMQKDSGHQKNNQEQNHKKSTVVVIIIILIKEDLLIYLREGGGGWVEGGAKRFTMTIEQEWKQDGLTDYKEWEQCAMHDGVDVNGAVPEFSWTGSITLEKDVFWEPV